MGSLCEYLHLQALELKPESVILLWFHNNTIKSNSRANNIVDVSTSILEQIIPNQDDHEYHFSDIFEFGKEKARTKK